MERMASRKQTVADKTWYTKESKERFSANARKKMETCFIGIIDKFETNFGYLWAHGSKRPRTDVEQQFKELWDKCRQEILDHANHQKRALQKEIDEYDFYWKRHQVKMSSSGNS